MVGQEMTALMLFLPYKATWRYKFKFKFNFKTERANFSKLGWMIKLLIKEKREGGYKNKENGRIKKTTGSS